MINEHYLRVELHCHTNMSAMDGVASATELINYTEENGLLITNHRGIAITDHGAVQAFPEAYKAAYGSWVKEIYGAEIYMIEDDNPKGEYFHAVLIVKNMTGLKNLYKLVSIAHTEYYYKRPLTPKQILSAHREGLLIGSACGAGELQTAINASFSEERLLEIAGYYDYLEIQPHEPESVNREVIRIGEIIGKPVVATGNVRYFARDDEIVRRVLQSGSGSISADKQPPLYFKSTKQMLAELFYLGNAKSYEVVVSNTNVIAEMVEADIKPVPDGMFLQQIDSADNDLVRICSDCLYALYDGDSLDIAKQRMDAELDCILKNGYASIYMIARRLVMKSAEDGFFTGCRGSVGSSIVAFLLGITEVDPLQYNIPFEVFAGINGDKLPDISINFDTEYQPIIHRYVKEMFGADKVLRFGTIRTITERAAHGFLTTFLDGNDPLDGSYEADNYVIKKLVGIKRTTAQHPGGLFILPKDKDVYDFTPVQHPHNDMESDVLVTHFDYRSLRSTLLSFDLLGHDNQTLIRKLHKATGVDIKTISLDDKAALDLLINTDSLGIPEFDTPFVRGIIETTKPTTFGGFTKIIGLSYSTNWFPASYELIKIGTATLDEVIAFREDIMTYLMVLGVSREISCEIMESVGKGNRLTDAHEEIMDKVGVPQWYIAACSRINYLFPKAHAVDYALTAFRIAWFKAHYPLAFYKSCFDVRNDFAGIDFLSLDIPHTKKRIAEIKAKNVDEVTYRDKKMLSLLQLRMEMLEHEV